MIRGEAPAVGLPPRLAPLGVLVRPAAMKVGFLRGIALMKVGKRVSDVPLKTQPGSAQRAGAGSEARNSTFQTASVGETDTPGPANMGQLCHIYRG